MLKKGEIKTIPLNKGHYGGPNDSVSGLTSGTGLIAQSKMPLGFYWGEDTFLANAGIVRARPSYLLLGTSAAGTVASCFFLAGVYFIVLSSGAIQKDASGWSPITGSTSTGTSKIYVDLISAAGSTSGSAVVSCADETKNPIAINGTVGTAITAGNAKGLTAQDENRLFCYNGGYLYYSDRGGYTEGYSSFFSLGASCYPVIAMMRVAGTLQVIKQCSATSGIEIFRKVGVNSLSTENIDLTYFSSPLGIQDGIVNNGIDGICTVGGNIFMWMKGQGLIVVTANGGDVIGDTILAESGVNSNYDAIIAPATNFRTILIKPVGNTTSLAFNIASGLVNGLWNINVLCKGYGDSRGMFGISGEKSPVILNEFPTTTEDTTIVPKLYTPALDFGYPFHEKFLQKVFIDGRGITSLKIYRRLTAADSFTLEATISNPKRVVIPAGGCRFGELCLLLEGSPLFMVKALGVEFDVGETIFES